MVAEWYDAKFKNLNQGIKNVLELKEIMWKIYEFLQNQNIFGAVVKLASTSYQLNFNSNSKTSTQHHATVAILIRHHFLTFSFKLSLFTKPSNKEMKTVEESYESLKVLDQRN